MGLCARSGTGKTTLMTHLLPIFKRRGLNLGVVKHSHHDFEIDQENKDSYRIRQAGAREVILISRHRWALIHENEEHILEPDLLDMLSKMDLKNLDLILLEGFKHEVVPKIELHRASMGQELMHPLVSGILAVASDSDPVPYPNVPLLDLDDPEKIADFIIKWMNDR